MRIANRDRTSRRTIGVLALLAAALMLAGGGMILAGTTVGSFEIDGNLPDDSGPGEPLDWDSPEVVETVLDDELSTQTDDAFAQGSKNNEPDGWSYGDDSIPPKSDLDEGAVFIRTFDGEQFLYVRHTRLAKGGDQHFDYEFNQTDDTYVNSQGATVPFRTAGDPLVTFDTDKGGQILTVGLLTWDGDEKAGEFVPAAGFDQGTDWDGATNADGAFGEAAINLTTTIGGLGCGDISQVWLKTRASSEVNSALKDRIEPVSFLLCDFDVEKTPDPSQIEAGGTVEYTIKVTNNGPLAGSTEAEDVYDPRVTIVESSLPAECTNDAENHTVTCQTDELDPGEVQTFTYQATMPSDLGGDEPDPDLCNGEPLFAIVNEVTVQGGEAEAIVCVEASPNLTLVKSAVGDPDDLVPGEQLTFQLDFQNTGSADATDVTVSDGVPTGTTFVSCTGAGGVEGEGCSEAGGTVTFDLGTVGTGDSGSVSFTVQIAFGVGCQVCNEATLNGSLGDEPIDEVTSNLVCVDTIPLGDPTLATASGNAFALHVEVPLLMIDETISGVGSSQSGPGDPPADEDSSISESIPSVASVTLLEATSDAGITAIAANDVSTATTAKVSLLGGAVTASAVHGVADATATGVGATASTFGSHIDDLTVGGVPVEEITYNQEIVVPGVGKLFVYDRDIDVEKVTEIVDGEPTDFWSATASVDMLRLEVDLGPLAGTQVVVSRAHSEAMFPATGICGPQPDTTVSGEAKVVSLTTDPNIASADIVTAGPIPATGGSDFAEAAHVGPLGDGEATLVDSGTAVAETEGGFNGSAAVAHSVAKIEDLKALDDGSGPAVTALAVHAEASSSADGSGADSEGDTTILGLTIGGMEICSVEDVCTPAPNTEIPLGPIVVHLNEQTETSSGNSTEITVNAIRIETPLGDVIIGQAHSDACFDDTGAAVCSGGTSEGTSTGGVGETADSQAMLPSFPRLRP